MNYSNNDIGARASCDFIYQEENSILHFFKVCFIFFIFLSLYDIFYDLIKYVVILLFAYYGFGFYYIFHRLGLKKFKKLLKRWDKKCN